MEKIFYIIIAMLLLILGERAFGQAPTDYIISDNSASITMGSTALYYSRTGHTGTANVGIGSQALQNNQIGNNNLAFGNKSLNLNERGNGNVAFGISAMEEGIGKAYNATSGSYIKIGFDANVAIGLGANKKAGFGSNNVAIGSFALYSHKGYAVPLPCCTVYGNDNVAVGSDALFNSYSGTGNVAIGSSALYFYSHNVGTVSGYNIAIGYKAHYNGGKTPVYAQKNVIIGSEAFYNNENGLNNIGIGYQAGYNELGSHKLYIENSNSSTPLIGGDFLNDVVGINVPVANLATNPTWKLQVGGDINATGSVRAAGVALTSDIRFKKNIVPLHHSLSNLLKLNSVIYDWKKEDFPERNFPDKKQFGLIAQEVEKIFPELVDTDANGYKSVNYIQITPILIESIKELTERIQKLETKLNN